MTGSLKGLPPLILTTISDLIYLIWFEKKFTLKANFESP